MLLDRCIRISIREEVRRLLEVGIEDLLKFNVYGDSDLRRMNAGNFTPTEPYCFVVLNRIEPTETQLPFIAVDTLPIEKAELELGNRAGRGGTVMLNILGRTDGESTDLASYLMDGIGDRFPIVNQNDVTYMGYAAHEVMAMCDITRQPRMESPGPLAEALILEGSLFNWVIVSFDYQVLI